MEGIVVIYAVAVGVTILFPLGAICIMQWLEIERLRRQCVIPQRKKKLAPVLAVQPCAGDFTALDAGSIEGKASHA